MNSKTYKNLPKSDRNERLERLSNHALEAILPVEKFLTREDKPDKGVDSSIEVIDENENFTNFRAQIQLKGTYEQDINEDESISFSIETSNIRYLWNNLTSIYVLYIQPRRELRFVWLKDEIKRLNEENPDWQNQGKVTLRFTQILDIETVSQIHEQIAKEGLLHRKIKETLTTNPESNSRIEINSFNLELIDQNDAKRILDFYGLELLNTGYEKFVLEKYNLLADGEKKEIKFLLLKSRAEGMLGKYRTALDTLGTIELLNCELSLTEKFHFDSTENHINWQLGNINTEEFLLRLKILSNSELAKDSILDKFSLLRFELMNERDFSKMPIMLVVLKDTGKEILLNNDFSYETKVNIKFDILEMELKLLILKQILVNGRFAMFAIAKIILPEDLDEVQNFNNEMIFWLNSSNQLLKDAKNITTKADIAYLQTKLWFHMHQSHESMLNNVGKEYSVSEKDSTKYIGRLQNSIDIYLHYQQDYSVIRTKMLMVEIFSLIGKSEESETLRKQINRQANLMSYEALKNLTEFSLHKILYDYSQKNK